MTKEKLLENIRAHMNELGWAMDYKKVQDSVLESIEKDLDQLIESSKNCKE